MQPSQGNQDPQRAPAPAGEEPRSARRNRTLKEAKLITSDSTLIDCLVRDLSESGARITFSAPTTPPQTFWLLLVSTHKMRPARLQWQRGLSAGLTFTGPEQPGPARV